MNDDIVPNDRSIVPNNHDGIYSKLNFYLTNKITITFRLAYHQNYFITGIVKEIVTDIKDCNSFRRHSFLNKNINNNFSPSIYGIIIQLSNESFSYFLSSEIDMETIIPTSYNPIRYFVREQISDELRNKIFNRDNFLCKLNLDGCTKIAEELDHIIPVSC